MQNSGETIRAKVVLPCSVRVAGSELRAVRGVTEELTRESLVVFVPAAEVNGWLKAAAKLSIAVDLPFRGAFEPRVLECATTVTGVRALKNGVRIDVSVERMTVVSREREKHMKSRPVTHTCAAERGTAIARSQNDNPVIRVNHRTPKQSNLTGEHTMTLLKNFFIEEDGQDMIEYGLVISLVVIGGIASYQVLGGTITNVLNNVTTSLTKAL